MPRSDRGKAGALRSPRPDLPAASHAVVAEEWRQWHAAALILNSRDGSMGSLAQLIAAIRVPVARRRCASRASALLADAAERSGPAPIR